MKYIILIMLFTSCSSVSQYNQGCRDALDSVRFSRSDQRRNDFCDNLENISTDKKANKY